MVLFVFCSSCCVIYEVAGFGSASGERTGIGYSSLLCQTDNGPRYTVTIVTDPRPASRL